MGFENGRVIAQQLVDLAFAPDVELSLHAFAVGVVGAGESVFGAHVAEHEFDGLRDARG